MVEGFYVASLIKNNEINLICFTSPRTMKTKNNEKNEILSQVRLRLKHYAAIFFKRELISFKRYLRFCKDHIISFERASNESVIKAF